MPEVAEPLAASAQSTVTVWALRLDSATVKVSVALPASPSVTDGLSMVSAGAAAPPASVIVPAPSSVSASPLSSALTALNSRRMTVSSSSATSSPVTVTSMVWLVWPGAKVSVPLESFT